jgi:TonB family protein
MTRSTSVLLLLPFLALTAGVAIAGPQDESALRRTAELGGEEGRTARYRLAELMLKRDRPAEAVELARAALLDEPARVLLCRAKARLPEGAAGPGAVTIKEFPQKEEMRVGPRLLDVTLTRPAANQSPKPLYNQAPVDPEGSYRRTPGDVLIQADIDEEGCVREVKVVRGLSPGRNRVAEEAVRRWTFQPGTVEGKPVASNGFPVIVPFGTRHPG